ncbi:MAG: DUF6438 domain-containing protein [Bacteroidota bacterium]
MSRTIIFLLVCFVSSANWGCKGSKAGESSASYDVPEDFELIYSRGGCKGTCPVYTLYVAADGTVNYLGEAFVEMEGKYEKKITQEAVMALVTSVKEAAYFEMKGKYDDPNLMDVPSSKLECRMNGKKHVVVNRVGAPDHLIKLEEQIGEIVGKEGYSKVKE